MATWAIRYKAQNGRLVYVQVKRNSRTWRRKPVAVATTYPSQAAANAGITSLFGRHASATAVQLS